MPPRWRDLDLWGAGLSLACGIHCAALSVALLTMPALWLRGTLLGLPLSWWRLTELVLSVIVFVIACWALAWGWQRHRRALPLALGLTGMGLIGAGLLLPLRHPALGSTLVLTGGLLLAFGHWRNRVALQRFRHGVAPT